MHVYHADLAERQVPRYTSYPTAAEFHEGIGAEAQAEALQAIAPGTAVSLYVHFPYCHEICWYCGCNTGAIGRGERLDAYIDALEREMVMVASASRGRATSVHFGGGSPNALGPAGIARLCESIRTAFAPAASAEWAIEVDPRHVDDAMADAIGAQGFGRVSLGVQTLALRVQAAINRFQPLRTISAVTSRLRRAGVGALNFDLMYGLPHQSLDDIASTIAQLLPLAPDRVAMFGYAHLPRMLARQRMIDPAALPDAEARFWQNALAHDLLVEAGYEAIGFDHFALPHDSLAIAASNGRLRRNFQGFTDDPARTLIGLGASAISQFDALMVQNDKHVGCYRMRIANGRLAGSRGTRVDAEDRLRGAAIERLLCDGAINLSAIARQHGWSAHSIADIRAPLAELVDRGLVATAGDMVLLTDRARPYSRLIAATLDSYRPLEGRFSHAV